ncbi:MAG: InlB B-repeat-containing protein [Candidatus Coproplasma sp.]
MRWLRLTTEQAQLRTSSITLLPTTEDTFTVTFKDFDGTVLATEAYLYDEEVVVPENLDKVTKIDGVDAFKYKFIGWKSDIEGDDTLYTNDTIPLAGHNFVDSTNDDVTYTAVYEYKYLMEIHLTGDSLYYVLDKDATPSDEGITVVYKVTYNSGINSLKLLFDYDAEKFYVSNVVVDNSVLDNFDYTLTEGYQSTDRVILALEGLKDGTNYSSGTSMTTAFLTITYKFRNSTATPGEYFFGFKTEYPTLTTQGELPGENRSTAYRVYDPDGEEGDAAFEQCEVRIVVDTSAIRVVVRDDGEIQFAGNDFEYDGEEIELNAVTDLEDALKEYGVIYTYSSNGKNNSGYFAVDTYDSSVSKYYILNGYTFTLANINSFDGVTRYYTKDGDNYVPVLLSADFVVGTEYYTRAPEFTEYSIASASEFAALKSANAYVYRYYESTVTATWYTDDKSQELDSAPVNAGYYRLVISVSEGIMYHEYSAEYRVRIIPCKLSYDENDLSAAEKNYNAAEQTWTVSDVSALNDLITDIANNKVAITSVSGSGTDAGVYGVTVTLTASANYTVTDALDDFDGDSMQIVITGNILQAINTWLLTPESTYSKTYDGSSVTLVDPTDADATFGTAVFTYSIVNGSGYAADTECTDVGTYYVKIVVEETTNYTGLEAYAVLSITPATLKSGNAVVNADWVKANYSTDIKIYNTTEHSWTMEEISGTKSFTFGDEEIATLSNIAAIADTDYVNANVYANGDYIVSEANIAKISLTFAIESPNFVFEDGTQSLVVEIPARIQQYAIKIVTLDQEAVYTGSEPAVSQDAFVILDSTDNVAYGFVTDELFSEEEEATKLNIVLVKEAGVNVGTYNITASADNTATFTNYDITYVGYVEDDNLEDNIKPVSCGTFTITYKFIGVPSFDALTYNGTAQTVENGEGDGYTYSITETNAGTYEITVTLKDNYAWENAIVNKTTIDNSVTYYLAYSDGNGNTTYYEAYLLGSFSANQIYYTKSTGTVYNKVSDVATPEDGVTYYTYNSESSSYEKAENLTEFAEGVDYYTRQDNVDIFTEVTNADVSDNRTSLKMNITISPAQVTVVVGDGGSQYSDDLSSIDYQITGTVYDDDAINVTTNTTATTTSDVGEYVTSATYTFTDTLATNYIVTVKDGVYTITHKEVANLIAGNFSFDYKYYTGAEVVWTASECNGTSVTGYGDTSVEKNGTYVDANQSYTGVNYVDDKYSYSYGVTIAVMANYKFADGTFTQTVQVPVYIRQAANEWTTAPSFVITDNNDDTYSVSLGGAAKFSDESTTFENQTVNATMVVYSAVSNTQPDSGDYVEYDGKYYSGVISSVNEISANRSYYVIYTVTGNDNYLGTGTLLTVTTQAGLVVIPKAYVDGSTLLSILAGGSREITYDGAAHTVQVATNAKYTITASAAEFKNANTYTVTLALINQDYQWCDDSGVAVDKDNKVYTLIINKADLSIVIANNSIYYLDDAPEYSASANFVGGESFATYNVTPAYISTYAVGSGVGTYDITMSNESDVTTALSVNYNVTVTDGVLTVNKLIITNSNFNFAMVNSTVTYNGEVHYVYATNGGTAIADDDVIWSKNGYEIVADYQDNGQINAGTYTVKLSFTKPDDNDNISFSGLNDISATLTIEQRHILVTVIGDSKVYGEDDPDISDNYTVDFQSGKDPDDGKGAIIGSEISFTVTRVLGDYVDSFEMSATANQSNSNYHVQYVTAYFVISKATNEWTTAPFVADDLVYTYINMSKPDDYNAVAKFGKVTFTFYRQDDDFEIGYSMIKYAGSYYMTFVVEETNNYTGLSETINFTIAKRGVEATFSDATFVYDATSHSIAISNVTDGVTVTVTYTIDGADGNSAKYVKGNEEAYEVVANLSLTNDNYEIAEGYSSLTAHLTITRAKITAKAINQSVPYGAPMFNSVDIEDMIVLVYSTASADSAAETDGLTFAAIDIPGYGNGTCPDVYSYDFGLSYSFTNTDAANSYEITLVHNGVSNTVEEGYGIYTIVRLESNDDGAPSTVFTVTANDVEYLFDLDITSKFLGGVIDGEVNVTYTYSTDGGTTWTSEVPKNAGTYKVKATFAATTNYEQQTATATFEITKATLKTISGLTFNADTATWTAPTQTTGNKTIDCGVTYLVNGVEVDSATYTATVAGVYEIVAVATGATAANYNNSVATNANAYLVTFDPNKPAAAIAEVENMPANVVVFEGQQIAVPATRPTLGGYDFVSWNTTASGTTVFDFGCGITANVTIYASWNIATYTVEWYVNGVLAYTDSGIHYGDTVTYSHATPTKDTDTQYSYTFKGWNDVEDTEEVLETLTATGNMRYYAIFSKTANGYTLTFVWMANGVQRATDSVVVAYGASLQDIVSAKAIGADIMWHDKYAWAINTDFTGGVPQTMPDGNLTLYGGFLLNIGVGDVNGDGSVDANDIIIYRQYIVGGYGIVAVEDAYLAALDYDYTLSYFLIQTADVNKDGKADIRDVTSIRMALVGGYGYYVVDEYTVNGDEIITGADIEETQEIVKVDGEWLVRETESQEVITVAYEAAEIVSWSEEENYVIISAPEGKTVELAKTAIYRDEILDNKLISSDPETYDEYIYNYTISEMDDKTVLIVDSSDVQLTTDVTLYIVVKYEGDNRYYGQTVTLTAGTKAASD